MLWNLKDLSPMLVGKRHPAVTIGGKDISKMNVFK